MCEFYPRGDHSALTGALQRLEDEVGRCGGCVAERAEADVDRRGSVLEEIEQVGGGSSVRFFVEKPEAV